MELEVKHLAPYLPYGLKLQYVVRGVVQSTGIMRSISHNDFETHPTRVNINYQGEEHIWMFRPILRPLSDLTKEIEHNGEKFVPIEKCGYCSLEDCTNESGEIEEITSSHILGFMPFNYFDKLLEWHFDVFGLIPNGLAIDINTLEVGK